MTTNDEPDGFDFPDTIDLASVDAAEVALIRLAARRRIAPREALYFSWMLEHRRRAISDRSLEQQMRELEAKVGKGRGEEEP
jgi:hypothetical protein